MKMIKGKKMGKKKRNIIWYNPPCPANTNSNIGKIFFKLLRKNFSRGHNFYKIFNKNTVKLSYSSTKNMASLITTHNRSIVNPNDQVYGCNCMVKNECPLHHKWLTPGINYQATVISNKDGREKIYYGLCETAFKERFWIYISSFKHEKNRNKKEHSNYIWALKKDKIIPSIKWKILRVVSGKLERNCCILCLTEKLFIINSIWDNRVLNKRSEFVNK